MQLLQQYMMFEDWWMKYKPIANPINTTDANGPHLHEGDGPEIPRIFETFGSELEFVKKANPDCVWTLLDHDDDGNQVLTNGFHFVNRAGYYITEKPHEGEGFMEVIVDHENDFHYEIWHGTEYAGDTFDDLRKAELAAMHFVSTICRQRPGLDPDVLTIHLVETSDETGETVHHITHQDKDNDLYDALVAEYYPRQDWEYEVENGDTNLSYDEWVEHSIDRDYTLEVTSEKSKGVTL